MLYLIKNKCIYVYIYAHVSVIVITLVIVNGACWIVLLPLTRITTFKKVLLSEWKTLLFDFCFLSYLSNLSFAKLKQKCLLLDHFLISFLFLKLF